MPLDFTPSALEEINRRADRLGGKEALVLLYWDRDSMDTRRLANGQTEWYIAKPGFWQVELQPLSEFPLEIQKHPALHTVAGYAVLGEGKDKQPMTGRFTVDYRDGQFSVRPASHETGHDAD